MTAHAQTAEGERTYGLVAEFDDPDVLLGAVKKAYEAGYRTMDAYSPFPIHGLAEAMGVNKTLVPLCTLMGGITGAFAGFFMQWFASAVHYPYAIGGKPFNSWPAFIPITFECAILFGAFAALGSMLFFNGLPRLHHPIFGAKRFARASSDGFFLCIEASDAQFDDEKTRTFLQDLEPVEVSTVVDDSDEGDGHA